MDEPLDLALPASLDPRFTLFVAVIRTCCLTVAALGVFAFVSRNDDNLGLRIALWATYLIAAAASILAIQRLFRFQLLWGVEGVLIGFVALGIAGLHLLLLRLSH